MEPKSNFEYAIYQELVAQTKIMRAQTILLQNILNEVSPQPATKLRFNVELEGQIYYGVTTIPMTNSQQLTASITPVDAKGQPAPVDGIPQWASSDETIATVVPADDGMSAVVAAVGPIGNAKVSVTADADLGSGVSAIFGVLDVPVTQGAAVGFKITTSDPVEQGSGTPEPPPARSGATAPRGAQRR